jgi:nitroreductase
VTIDLTTALTTTRTIRYGLDFDRPVDRELLIQCLDLARFAPNGANRQNWRFLILDDPTTITAVAKFYRKASAEYLATSPSTGTPQADAAAFLAKRIDHAPALILACQLGRLTEQASAATRSGFYGSIFPAVWSFSLAARASGLGTAMTTVHLAYEQEIATLLNIPYESVTQIALIVVAHTTNPHPKPAPRLPTHDIVAHNTWRW